MPKVSRNIPKEETLRRMREALIRAFVSITDKGLLEKFVRDLLTPSELVMIAKRLMASILLQKGYAQSAICATLKLSRTTVNTIQRELLKGGDGYKTVYRSFFHNVNIKERRKRNISETIDLWLSALQLPVKGSPGSMKRWEKAL